MWNTENINKASEDIRNGKTVKSLVRDVTIDSILVDQDPIFPFFINKKSGSNINTNLRAANIKFTYSEEELTNYCFFMKNPSILHDNFLEKNTLSEQVMSSSIYRFQLFFINFSKTSDFFHTKSFLILHYIIFNFDKNITIINSSKHSFIDLIFNLYEKLPFYLKPGLLSVSKNSILFDNGCHLRQYYSADSSRGYNHDFLIFINFNKIDFINNTNKVDFINNIIIPQLRNDARICIATDNKEFFNLKNFTNFERINLLRIENLNKLI